MLNSIFTFEMLLRVAAMGGPLAYAREPWNVFDSIMVRAALWPATLGWRGWQGRA